MSFPEYTRPLYWPPSEADSLIFQITEGCSCNNCAFCGMYIHKPFRLKPVPDILAEIAAVSQRYEQTVHRVLLSDGDAAVYPAPIMFQIL
jgi:radical SAM superfamily enzyme YgiQ (UPF0313 family)